MSVETTAFGRAPQTDFDPAEWETYRDMVPKGSDPEPDDEAAVDMRTDIIVAYVYLCKRVVAKMKKSMPQHVERDDLESWAKIGLMQAVTRYDHTINVPFEAFATQRMRSVIMDGIRDADWAPRSLRKKHRDISKLEDKIRENEGRDPTPEELAAVIVTERFNKEKFEPTQDQFEDAVLDVMADISNTKYASEIASHTYIEGSLEAQNKPSTLNDEDDQLVYLLKAATAKCLQNMEIKKAVVIALHYYNEKKLADVAAILKMSEVKVGMLHSEAVLEIWDAIEATLREE